VHHLSRISRQFTILKQSSRFSNSSGTIALFIRPIYVKQTPRCHSRQELHPHPSSSGPIHVHRQPKGRGRRERASLPMSAEIIIFMNMGISRVRIIPCQSCSVISPQNRAKTPGKSLLRLYYADSHNYRLPSLKRNHHGNAPCSRWETPSLRKDDRVTKLLCAFLPPMFLERHHLLLLSSVVGPSGVGKSTVCLYLLYYFCLRCSTLDSSSTLF
jgi:hypothetical protein